MGHRLLPLLTGLVALAILVPLTLDRPPLPLARAQDPPRSPTEGPTARLSGAGDPQWGDLRARFVLEGAAPPPRKLEINKDEAFCGQHHLQDESLIVSPRGEIANVLLVVRSKGVAVHPDYADSADDAVPLLIKHCRIDPHLLAVRVTQKLEIRSVDPLAHAASLYPLDDTPASGILPTGSLSTHAFTRPQRLPTPICCSIHPWMKGYVMIHDNPYAAVSSVDGELEIKNLPTGKLQFMCWQEMSGYLAIRPDSKRGRFTLEIRPGMNDLGTITISADQFLRE